MLRRNKSQTALL
ncbi:hypothetical protein A2U01_0118550, partial [Trifolium medium]|nr:hypothetical protein [Trifolium medium]